jgi:hypothetical protein
MKVVRNRPGCVDLAGLLPGDVYELDGTVYLVTRSGSKQRAVNVVTGDICEEDLDHRYQAIPLNVTLVEDGAWVKVQNGGNGDGDEEEEETR